jgi:hypothetical protein
MPVQVTTAIKEMAINATRQTRLKSEGEVVALSAMIAR